MEAIVAAGLHAARGRLSYGRANRACEQALTFLSMVEFRDNNPHTSPETQGATALALEGMWRVVVLNDPVNLMSYVVMVFKKVFGFDESTARRHMLEVHEQGRSIVWSGLREKAEAYAYTLQQWHLTAVLETDEAH